MLRRTQNYPWTSSSGFGGRIIYTGIASINIIAAVRIYVIPLQVPPKFIPQLKDFEMMGLATREPIVSITAITAKSLETWSAWT
jgi:hypothetical protein